MKPRSDVAKEKRRHSVNLPGWSIVTTGYAMQVRRKAGVPVAGTSMPTIAVSRKKLGDIDAFDGNRSLIPSSGTRPQL